MPQSLAPQLRREYEPKGQAQSDRKVWLDHGKIDDKEEPGDEYQRSVVKDVVGNQQEEEGPKGSDGATKQTRQSEMFRTNPKTMNARGKEKGSRNDYGERKTLLTQEPMLVVRHQNNLMAKSGLSNPFITQAEHVLRQVYLPRIMVCLKQLSAEQIWWRPNEASNSVGNLVLHLAGNVRQWIISGLGSAPDNRERDREFGERGPLPRRTLVSRLRKTVEEACRVLGELSAEDLARVYTIQKFRVTGMQAAFHVAEHFSHHAGQIILLTKMLKGRDLKFTHLPGETKRKIRKLPAL